ncbi:hypothetical protein RFI_07087 [Reticulomyxa filosa]|uniref:Uncharacterized protein n=1 Tax=Reticulomyxa filosa TaxID=46433 RepID=X6NW30_RETFI|nr:hypothetical protein RFI_07087 [Reticulomyxa filosa]|eukprot:ETO30034.1 hypothetical protein RFI_07087 [Reticulomyxa filosa]
MYTYAYIYVYAYIHDLKLDLMILSMIAPYLVAYTAFGSLLQGNQLYDYGYNDGKSSQSMQSNEMDKRKYTIKSLCQVLFTLALITPLSIMYFVAIDVLFILLETCSFFVNLLSCGKYALQIRELSSSALQKMLGLTYMQAMGYRRFALFFFFLSFRFGYLLCIVLLFVNDKRCRTLSQLMFESIPQFILQVQVLIYAKTHVMQSTTSKKEFDVSCLILSVVLTLIHISVELWMLSVEGIK